MIILEKNKIIYENNIRPCHEDYVRKEVDSIIPYLNETIDIKDGTTLEHFFKIVEEDIELMQIVFGSALGHFPLTSYIEELKKDCMFESRENLEYIEVSWGAEQFDYRLFYEKNKDKKDGIFKTFGPLHEPEENIVNRIDIYIYVGGWGKNDMKEEDNDADYISYAIGFTPLYRLKHLPIKLNKEFIMRDENDVIGSSCLVKGEKEFSVYEVFGEILSEISFYGLPEDRDATLQETIDIVDGHKANMENIDEE